MALTPLEEQKARLLLDMESLRAGITQETDALQAQLREIQIQFRAAEETARANAEQLVGVLRQQLETKEAEYKQLCDTNP